MGGSPDAAPPTGFLASRYNHDQEATHDHPTHRDRDHRSRPGRPVHRLPPQRRAAPSSSSTATSGSATTGGSSGTRLRLYTPAKYDGLPGMPFPAAPWYFPGKDEVADYLESYALQFDLPVRMSTRVDRLEARPDGGLHRVPRRRHDHLRQRRGRDRHLRADAERARTSPPTSTRRSCSCTRASTAGRRSCARPGAGGRRLALRLRHRLRGSPRPARRSCVGRDRGQIPFRPESRRRARASSRSLIFVCRHVLTRRTPIGRKEMDEVRSHGGPMLRVKREDLDAARRGAQRGPGGRSQRRPAGARRRHRRRRRPTSSGAPASGRSSTGSTCRSSARTAGPRSTAAWSTRRPGCSSAAWRSSTRSARWSSRASAATRSTSPAGSSPGAAATSSHRRR